MRARLILKLVSIVVFLVLTVLGAHTLSGSSSSPVNPGDIARNGLTGVCANQNAVQAAGGSGSGSGTAVSPSQVSQLQASDPAGVAALERALGSSSLNCPTNNP